LNKKLLIFLGVFVLFITSCGVYNSLMNLSKLKFKLGSVNNFKVAGISINNKSKLSDFGTIDIVNLTSKVLSGDFPVSFTVNVLAQNPNKSKDANIADISLESFPWTLYINDKKTISGNISNPVKVPAVENTTQIPLEMSLDLKEFFSNDGLNDLVELALKLGGSQGSPSNLKIIAEPVLGTPVGSMSYPNPITIIDNTFN